MSEEQSEAKTVSAAETGAGATITCGSCGAEVKAGARVCPECAHGLYRTCFCGLELPASERVCPKCGADWSQSMRVSRRRSHSHRPRKAEAVRYALLGAAWTVGGVVLLYLIATLLALAAPGVEGALPASLFTRLALAGQGIAHLAGSAAAAVSRHSGLILGVLLVVLLGALGGLVTYLVGLRRGPRRRPSSDGRRRVHRKRRR